MNMTAKQFISWVNLLTGLVIFSMAVGLLVRPETTQTFFLNILRTQDTYFALVALNAITGLIIALQPYKSSKYIPYLLMPAIFTLTLSIYLRLDVETYTIWSASIYVGWIFLVLFCNWAVTLFLKDTNTDAPSPNHVRPPTISASITNNK